MNKKLMTLINLPNKQRNKITTLHKHRACANEYRCNPVFIACAYRLESLMERSVYKKRGMTKEEQNRDSYISIIQKQ